MKFRQLLAGLLLTLLATGAYAQEIILKVAHFLPPNSTAQKGAIQPWCDKISKESGGRIRCQIYPALQLGGTSPQLVDQLRNGVADVIWTLPSFSAGRFPITEVMELPFMLPAGGIASSRAIWDFYLRYGQKDFDAYKVLALYCDPAAAFHTTSKPLRNLASMKGLKIRTASRMAARLVSALGATPVNMPPPQIADAISKGVIDGSMASWELVPSVKLDELTKYHTREPDGEVGFYSAVLAFLMNKQKYDSLPPDLKEVIDRNSGPTLVDSFANAWDLAGVESHKRVKESGGAEIVVTLADYLEMRKAAAPVEQEYIKDAVAKGLDGLALLAAAKSTSAKYIKKMGAAQ
jgi:TRAP-type C4-dicarboxylate transport system substrate-binding protein